MTRKKLVAINLITCSIVTFTLIFFAKIYKTEVEFLDFNPFYSLSLLTLFCLTLFYVNHFIINKPLIYFTVTTSVFLIAMIISIKMTNLFISFLVNENENLFGWTFKFRFLDILLTNILILILLDLIRRFLSIRAKSKTNTLLIK